MVQALAFMLTFAINAEDLGQEKIRQAWQSLEQQNQDKKTWMRDHGFVDLAEEYWLAPSKVTQEPKDVFAAKDYFNRKLKSQTFSPQVWLPAFLNQWRAFLDRPIDAIPLLLEFFEWFLMLSVWAICLAAVFHLWVWAGPITKDFPSLLKSITATRLTLVLSFICALLLQALPTWSLIASCLLLGYLRASSFAVFSILISSLLWIYPSFRNLAIESSQSAAWIEAYEKGRTRIEYSLAASANLTPIQRAHWANWNGDLRATRFWLEKTESSIEKKNLELILRSKEEPPSALIPEFESLRTQDPQNPILVFNLSQLQTKAQNLVSADRLRQEMRPQDFSKLLDLSESRGQFLLTMPLGKSSEVFHREFLLSLDRFWADRGSGLLSFQLLAVILLALVGAFMRQRASGLCQFTGECSPRLHSLESPLYLSGKTHSIKGARQQADAATRNHKSQMATIISSWSWLVPELKCIVTEGSLWPSFFWLMILTATFIYSVPSSLSLMISGFFKIDPIYSLSQTGPFYLGFGVWLFIYVAAVLQSYKKGDR